jgi:hypothetical protein
MPEDLDWLREQYQRPKVAYKTAEWARLAGLPRHKVVRWFVKKGIIKRGDGSHHDVTRDEVQQRWPSFWRSIRRRIADLLGPMEDAA